MATGDNKKTLSWPDGTAVLGAAVGVDVSSIEKELSALWRHQNQSAEQAVVRACSWNLIIHCQDDEALKLATAVAESLVKTVPTRTLLVHTNPYATTGKEIEAWVSANCQVAPGGGKLLCSEEVHLESRGAGVQHVPSLLRALLVPDVPTALWWAGAPPADASAVRLLLSGVDRLVVDTVHAKDGTLSRLAHVGGLLDSLILADLNWLRTASLRSLLASFFDPPAGHDPLWHVTRVRIEATDSGLAAARLMVGWLTSRLRWNVTERIPRPHGQAWRLQSKDEMPIGVDIDVVMQCSRASGLASILLETASGERFLVKDAGGDHVDIQTPALGKRSVLVGEPRLEELLVSALGARGRDRLYAVALHRAVELER